MKQKSVNRWSVVFGAVLLQVCLGAIYSWSLFNQPLMDKFGWSNEEVYMTYSIAIFVFAFSTIISGRLQDKIGPRKVATIGGLLYGGGLILASFATSLPMLYFCYGVLGGAGVGFAYVCPLSTCVKWFPEKKGFITGIAVGAFGAGSLVFKSIIQHFLGTVGVSSTFLYLGIIYLALVVIGAQFLKLPEASTPNNKTAAIEGVNLTVGEMIKEKSFYFIWIMFMLGCMPGLLVIGLAKDIGLALDGDADRLIVCDEHGSVLDGDQIMAICAQDMMASGDLVGKTLVSTVMSNMALEVFMRDHGGRMLRTPVGDRHVVEAMRNEHATMGGEQSGHLVFMNYGTTGDGLLAGLQLLRIMRQRDKPLSSLAGLLELYPQELINVRVERKVPFEECPGLLADVEKAEKELGDRGRVLLRYSGTESLCRVMVEGEDSEQVKRLASYLAESAQKNLV